MLKNRIMYGLAALVSIALFVFYHNFFFFYMLLIVAVLPVVSFMVSRRVWNRVAVKMEIPLYTIGTGNRIEVDYTVDNPTVFPMPGIHLEFSAENVFYHNSEIQVISLPLRRKKETYRWNISSVYSGMVRLRGGRIYMQDYTGLFMFSRKWDEEASVTVLPAESDIIMNVIEGSFSDDGEYESDDAATVDDVTQVKDFREYIPGDRIQRINWKISARHDTLYVKEFEQEYDRTVTLLVELRRDSGEVGFLDELITAFYSAASKMLDMDMHFNIQWYDVKSECFHTESVNEPDGLVDVIQQIFMMESYDDYYAFRRYTESEHRENDLAIYFTSPSFSGYDDRNLIGTFKERVALICLY